MIDFVRKNSYGLKDLEKIVSILRSPGGCPWDAEQDHKSLRRALLEESCEVIEAINEEDPVHLQEELGDVLLQVVFHADIERQAGRFDLEDVADGVSKKLIFRHPHVFGDVQVHDSEEVLVNWDALKRQEKSQETYTDTLTAVAKSLPALWRAEKVQKKAAKVGFDWPDVSGALDKVSEETAELRAAMDGDGDVGEELGDLLFAAVNVGRFLKLDPEKSLTTATDKFAARFRRVEQAARAQGRELKDMTLAEMDMLWDQVKKQA